MKKQVKKYIVPINTTAKKKPITIKVKANTVVIDGDQKMGLVRNSRCVPVGTILPAPLGRRKKKSFKTKSEFIKFRCTIYEKKMLRVKAKKCHLSLSEYLRRIAFEYKITARLTEEQIDLYKMLIRYHNNFKSIGNMFRQRNPKLTETVYQLAADIKNHLKRFDDDR